LAPWKIRGFYRRVTADLWQNPRTQERRLFSSALARKWISAVSSRIYGIETGHLPNESGEERQMEIASRLTQPAPAASMVRISDSGAE
jgi:hypothetical protein